MSWVYETLDEAAEIAKSGMSKKEGLVLLILYKRDGVVSTGTELEAIFRDWNNARRSPRAAEELGFALRRLLAERRIQAEGLSTASAFATEPLAEGELASLRNIELTKDGWFRVGAMRAVIDIRLRDAEEKFGSSHGAFLSVIRKFGQDTLGI
jgi:hypothetical protein